MKIPVRGGGVWYKEEEYPGEDNRYEEDVESQPVALRNIVEVAGEEWRCHSAYHGQCHCYAGNGSVVPSTKQVCPQSKGQRYYSPIAYSVDDDEEIQ